MILTSLREFLQTVPSQTRLMGLDIGTKRIGIAFSDPQGTIAFPRETYERQNMRKDLGVLGRMCREENVQGIVMGLPLSLNNEEEENCQIIRTFADKLYARTTLPTLLMDERMSTAAVTRVMKDAGVKRQERHTHDDKLAACYILQTVLDAR